MTRHCVNAFSFFSWYKLRVNGFGDPYLCTSEEREPTEVLKKPTSCPVYNTVRIWTYESVCARGPLAKRNKKMNVVHKNVRKHTVKPKS